MNSFVSQRYLASEWMATYDRVIPVVLTTDLGITNGLLPPGEKIERGKKATKRKAAGVRAAQAPDVIDFLGMGSQVLRGINYQPSGRTHGYVPLGTQRCGRCKAYGHNKLTCRSSEATLQTHEELMAEERGHCTSWATQTATQMVAKIPEIPPTQTVDLERPSPVLGDVLGPTGPVTGLSRSRGGIWGRGWATEEVVVPYEAPLETYTLEDGCRRSVRRRRPP